MDELRGQYLTFDLDEEVYGIEIKYVTEILGMQPITEVVTKLGFIKGAVEFREKLIPVIDLRQKFGKQEIAYNDRTCIIVVNAEKVTVGLIVDSVSEVIEIEDRYISAPPSSITGIRNEYIDGIGIIQDEVKLLLDCNRLFNKRETKTIENIK